MRRTPQLRRHPRRDHGFTLVEIAIVLVIIGLLLGGLLKGQEMITQARIKNVANDFSGVTAAYFSFQDRYQAPPGDDGRAVTRWTGAKNGGNDGSLGGAYNTAPPPDPTAMTVDNTQNETLNFWWHLRLAGFVGGPTAGPGAANQPNNAVGGIVGAQSGGMGLSGNMLCSSNIPDRIALAVDAQLDDQRSNGGTMLGQDQVGVSSPTVGTAAANYIETGTNQYLLCRTI